MYNLLEYSHNYSMTSGSLWNYCKNEIDDNALDGKSFQYKTKIVGETPARLSQPGNRGDADQSPQPTVTSSKLKSLSYKR